MRTIIEETRLQYEDITNNASTRIPICICVDASYSMMIDRRMEQVNKGIRSFICDIRNNIYAVDSVELCVISFGSEVKVEREFSTEMATGSENERKTTFIDITPQGKTPLGKAVLTAIEKIEERQKMYNTRGVTTYKPWLILISDGKATDNVSEAAYQTISLQRAGRIKVLCVGIGDEANDLAQFKLDGEVIQLKDFALTDFFSWLSKSMSKQSRQLPEMDIDIPDREELIKMRR